MRKRPSAALIVALIALVFSLAGTAEAAFLITSNSQVGPGTISGHNPPSGDHANIVSGSVGTTDLHSQAVTGSKLAPAQKFRLVGTAGQPPFGNGGDGDCVWSNASDNTVTPNNAFNPVAFYKDPYGVVHITGVVQAANGSSGDMQCNNQSGDEDDAFIFRLPTADRPPHLLVFGASGALTLLINGVQDVTIDSVTVPAGTVFVGGIAGPGEMGIDGVDFRAAGAGTGITAARGVTHISLKQFRALVGGGSP
jgi:hypothetical protein